MYPNLTSNTHATINPYPTVHSPGAKVAIKTYDKSKMKDPAHWKRVHSEIKIMEQVSHPRIARKHQ